jgi:dTDP-4-dehydrorhamnose reductase
VRVLVTGASGLLGGRLAWLLAPRFDVVAARHRAPVPAGLPTVDLDLFSAVSVARATEATRADAVVHAAALADVDRCEEEPERARALNVDAAAGLAARCRRRGLRLVALSTDLVFDGTGRGSRETDPPGPLSIYARTKKDGEAAVLGEAPGAAVARVALVHGRGFGPGATASEAIAWALRRGQRLTLYTDQVRTPVDAESVAAAVGALLTGDRSGLFHLGGPERLSRHQLGLRVARLLDLPVDLIGAATQPRHPPRAPRPLDASLDSSRAHRELAYLPRPLDAGIRDGRPGPEP